MGKTATFVQLAGIAPDETMTTPLYRQIYDGLRQAILSGQLVAGTRLPATRALAAELHVARNTVLIAFAQLFAEGYVEGYVGSGTYVAHTLPDDLLLARRKPARSAVASSPTGSDRALSQRGKLLAETRVMPPRFFRTPRAFHPGLPALDAFPYDLWARLATRRWRSHDSSLMSYGDAVGYRPLREAIAAYVGAARAVRCTPEQVIIVAGSQQGLNLAACLLLDPGDAVWMEDPGYRGAYGALAGAGARLVPVPIDAEGLDVTAGAARCADVRMIYVSPSRQFPLGVTMSLARRLALLEWAEQHNAWVLEDDYDSEYRYAGRPLASLQGLDRRQHVIYIGTFSKVLFPGLRLGYLVVPPDLVHAFTAARALADRHSPLPDQATLADFIAEGHFTRHIRRMRMLYAERQAVLVEEAQRELCGLLDLPPAEAGMHLVGTLPDGVSDIAAAQRAAAFGVEVPALSGYAVEARSHTGLMLGYACVDEAQIREGVRQLARA
ncbi:MAG TPA: PLP-dependent aminotransferase family protein, partial [Ktedonobacterales bacterium]|nr:PLP-dependent aminotransferase family protein [Ktedonobacterales bacterium]